MEHDDHDPGEHEVDTGEVDAVLLAAAAGGHHGDNDDDVRDDVDDDAVVDGDPDSPGRKNKKKRDSNALRKAPQAPKRFKSSYICFFMAKQPEIKEFLGDKATVTEISKRSAEMWKSLPAEERAHWDDAAAKDKERYMLEKASYTGPWQVPWKRQKKHPSAPKRPMSAFLYFSQGKRAVLKKENPALKNTEISRLLGEMWRNASEEEKRPHVDREMAERTVYKVAIAEWRADFEVKQEAQRKVHAEQMLANSNAYAAAVASAGYAPVVGAPVGMQQLQSEQHPHPFSHTSHVGAPMQFSDPNQYRQAPTMNPGGFMYQAGMPTAFPYPYPPGPYAFATNGRSPVLLGPNGAPHYAVSAANYPTSASPNDGSSHEGGGDNTLSPGPGYDDSGGQYDYDG